MEQTARKKALLPRVLLHAIDDINYDSFQHGKTAEANLLRRPFSAKKRSRLGQQLLKMQEGLRSCLKGPNLLVTFSTMVFSSYFERQTGRSQVIKPGGHVRSSQRAVLTPRGRFSRK